MEEDIDRDRDRYSPERLPDTRSAAEVQLIIDELTAATNSLGVIDVNDGTYMKDRDCKPCLKEIIRLLNKDNKEHIARQTLGDLNVVKSDLIPLINQYCDFHEGDKDLFDLVTRLCTNLTSSVFLLFENQEIPTEPEAIKVYNKLIKGLYGYKRAFADDTKIWSVFNTYLWHTEEEVPFERLLILLRNILHIPVDATADMGMLSGFDTHSLCLYRMEKSGLFDTIIRIASETKRGSEFCFHIIEIIHLMLRDQNPATVAKSVANKNKRKLDEDDEDKKRLAELSARDNCNRQSKSARLVGNPRFRNSLFVVNNCQSLGQNPLLSRQIIGRNDDIHFDTGKTELRKSKNRKAMSSETRSAVISDLNVQPSEVTNKLKTFSKHFVEKVYTNYMQQIKHNLIQKKAAENDESYYLWSIQYFTAFSRHLFLNLEHITETMSTSTLHFIQILISAYQDKMKLEKKRPQLEKLSKRLHLALRAYREILYLIKTIEKESEFWATRQKIQNTIFRELEYSSLILTLLQQYEESQHCPEYLKDLISANDVFLDLYEQAEQADEFVIDDASEDQEQEEDDDEEQAIVGAAEGEDNASDLDTSSNKKSQNKKEKKERKKKKKQKKQCDLRSRYCCPDIMKSYIEALRTFKTNDSALNLQILKFFEKAVHDCRSEVMLMQASVFTCLLEIVDHHSSMPGHGRFVNLSKHLMSIFYDMLIKKRWMIQELLFWKTTSDTIEIEHAIDPPPPPVREPSPPLDETNSAANPDDILSDLAAACDESQSQGPDNIVSHPAASRDAVGSAKPDNIMRDLEAACADMEAVEDGIVIPDDLSDSEDSKSPDLDDEINRVASPAARAGSPKPYDIIGDIEAACEVNEGPQQDDGMGGDAAAVVGDNAESGDANEIISDIAAACDDLDLLNSQPAQVQADSPATFESVKD